MIERDQLAALQAENARLIVFGLLLALSVKLSITLSIAVFAAFAAYFC